MCNVFHKLHLTFLDLDSNSFLQVSPSAKVCDHAYDIPKLNKYLDFVNVMTYDYHGQWDKKTGHIAPIYEHPEDSDKTFNVNYTINYWLEKGLHPSKLIDYILIV